MTERSSFVVDADNVIDGGGLPPQSSRRLIVRNGVIEAIGSTGELAVPDDLQGAHITLSSGTTLLPGLVDTHTHLTQNGGTIPVPPDKFADDDVLLLQSVASARIHLQSGVTSVVDAGARGSTAFDLVRGVELGLIDGMPRLRVAGQAITRTGGHAWSSGTQADTPDEVRTAARTMLKSGANFIKIMATGGGTPGTYPHRPSYFVDELRAAADEAHEYGKISVAHCSATEGHRRCLEAGIDILYHGHFYDPDASLRYDEEVAKRIADSPVYLNPTLWINGGRWWALVLKSEAGTLSDEEQRALALRTRRYQGQKENVAKLIQLGVKIIAGTDAGYAIYPFGDLVTELREMVSCGMAPIDAITAATSLAAKAFQIDRETGSLTPGLSADLLVVDGDPSADIEALRNVSGVVFKGQIVRNDGALDAAAPGQA
jgi:imidazolonepropionase-like amidohydrolase